MAPRSTHELEREWGGSSRVTPVGLAGLIQAAHGELACVCM